jgi:hypothetical protein
LETGNQSWEFVCDAPSRLLKIDIARRSCYKLAAACESMATHHRFNLFAVITTGTFLSALAQSPTPTATPTSEGRVTVIFHDVQLLPEQAAAKPAAIDDKVDDGTALRTGDDSRSELTFADLTITRLGANTIFSFNKAGRSIRLDSGSILLYVRKNSGAAEITSKAVSVGITGTTVIFESSATNYDQLIVLEGDARFSLHDYPDQTTEVHKGQLLHVKAGATKLPKPGRVDLKRIVSTHPLIKNFPPLPSLDLIIGTPNRTVSKPSSPVSGQPAKGAGPVSVPNPPGPPSPGPVASGYPPVGVPIPTPTPHPTAKPTPTPRPTPKPRPTPRRYPPKPTPTPKRKFPPIKSPAPTPTPVQIR